MADFINKCLLQTNRIEAIKISNYKPRYLVCNVFSDNINKYKPLNELKYYFKLGYKPEEIFILAPSLKSNKCSIRIFENYIKTNEPSIPIYVPASDEEKLDETIIQNKMIFITFHQAKGLERKVVIIFGFDNSYFKYYNSFGNEFVCSNELYVATTRAKEHLTLIHHYKNDYLPFINKIELNKYVKIFGKLSYALDEDKINNEIDTAVTQIIKYLPQDIIDKCIDYLEIKNIRAINTKINIPNKIKNNELYEVVGEINGIAIPSLFEYTENKTMCILNYCLNPEINKSTQENKVLFDFWLTHLETLTHIKQNDLIIENLLYISTIYNCLRSQYIFKSYQIDTYNWLSNDILQKSMERMKSLNLTKQARFEERCFISNPKELFNRKICGQYDCCDSNCIYEFKCTNKLEKEHYLQLAVYMYIHKMNQYNKTLASNSEQNDIIHDNFRYFLYNILTDQLDEIYCDLNKLKDMIYFLLYHKYTNIKKISDQEFIETKLPN
jgi:hypothetical protein